MARREWRVLAPRVVVAWLTRTFVDYLWPHLKIEHIVDQMVDHMVGNMDLSTTEKRLDLAGMFA
jgi:hypothetical protein